MDSSSYSSTQYSSSPKTSNESKRGKIIAIVIVVFVIVCITLGVLVGVGVFDKKDSEINLE